MYLDFVLIRAGIGAVIILESENPYSLNIFHSFDFGNTWSDPGMLILILLDCLLTSPWTAKYLWKSRREYAQVLLEGYFAHD